MVNIYQIFDKVLRNLTTNDFLPGLAGNMQDQF